MMPLHSRRSLISASQIVSIVLRNPLRWVSRTVLVLGLLSSLWSWDLVAAAYVRGENNAPYTWADGTITYRLDPGGLGSLSHAQAQMLVSESFQVWKDVSLASGLSFSEGPDLAADVTAANIAALLTVDAEGNLISTSGDSIIIFDSDGTIFSQFFGVAAGQIILGIATPANINASTGTITAGLAIINGIPQATSNLDTLKATVIHEFGHFLNLGHSQVNIALASNTDTTDDKDIPTMFPYSLGNDAQLMTLHADDEVSMAYLYPNSTELDARGRITGHIRNRRGEGVSGVYVICEQVDTKAKTVSFVSGQDTRGAGFFECLGLEPGDYTVKVEPIFVAISSYDPDPPAVFSEFYNGDDESFDVEVDERSAKTNVTVAASSTIENIDIILNEDGRLYSGKAKAGQTVLAGYSFNYALWAPKGAATVRAQLRSLNPAADLQFGARCGAAFSYAPLNSFPLDDVVSSQASFESSGTNTTKSLTLDISSLTEEEGCELNFMVEDRSSDGPTSQAQFELIATLENLSPRLTLETLPLATTPATGDRHVATLTLKAQDDDFFVTQMRLTDAGTESFERVTAMLLYEDSNNNGRFDADDELLATGEDLNRDTRQGTFKNLGLAVAADDEVTLFAVYTFSGTSAGLEGLALFILVGILVGLRPQARSAVLTLSLVATLLSCGVTEPRGAYQPEVAKAEDITAQTFAFDDAYAFTQRNPLATQSVQDFFKK